MALFWLCACITGKDVDIGDSASSTNISDTAFEETSPDTEEDTAAVYQDPWPTDEVEWDSIISIVSNGEIVSTNDVLYSTSAPAGIDYCSSIRFTITNRSDEVLLLDENPSAWMIEDGFSWLSTPPASLSPQESIAVNICFNPVSQVEKQTISVSMSIPIDGATQVLPIEVEVPPPLRMVLVGDNGYTLISDSYGADFTYEHIPEDIGQTMLNITWGNDRFLRGSRFGGWTSYGYYEYSEDGITWAESTVGDDAWAFDCAYAFSEFLCVRGYGAYFTHSSNGSIFQHEVTNGGIGTFINDVVWTGTHIVGVGRDGVRAVATTTESFDSESVVSDSSIGNFNSVAFGDGLLVAVGGTDGYVISTSTDGGYTWLDQAFPYQQYASFQAVFYNGSTWLVEGNIYNSPMLLRSFDGYTFDGITSITDRYRLLGTHNGWFIARIDSTLYRSQDGETWEEVYTLPPGITPVAMAAQTWSAP